MNSNIYLLAAPKAKVTPQTPTAHPVLAFSELAWHDGPALDQNSSVIRNHPAHTYNQWLSPLECL